MNFDLQAVERAKQILTDRGYKAEIRECYPASNAYQIVVNFIDHPEEGVNEFERQAVSTLGVGVFAVVENDFVFLDD